MAPVAATLNAVARPPAMSSGCRHSGAHTRCRDVDLAGVAAADVEVVRSFRLAVDDQGQGERQPCPLVRSSCRNTAIACRVTSRVGRKLPSS